MRHSNSKENQAKKTRNEDQGKRSRLESKVDGARTTDPKPCSSPKPFLPTISGESDELCVVAMNYELFFQKLKI